MSVPSLLVSNVCGCCRVSVALLAHPGDMGLREEREQLDRWERMVQKETLDPVAPPDKLDPLDLLEDLDRGYKRVMRTEEFPQQLMCRALPIH